MENCGKTQEQIEEKVNQYQIEKQNREMKLNALLSKSKEKKGKELDDIEKEKDQLIKKKLKSDRIKEREKIIQRLNDNNSKMGNIKTYINAHPDTREADYLFNSLEKKYKLKEQKKVYNELAKRKHKCEKYTYSRKELDEFNIKQKERERLKEAELKEEKRKLKEQWKKVNDQLPKYEPSIKQKLKQEEIKIKDKKLRK